MSIIIPYLHLLGIMVLMGSLISEHIMLKPRMTNEQIKALAIIDLVYGLSAVLILITGLLRWFVYGKGAAFYNHNSLFHLKLTLFAIAAILSVFPTIRFLKWRKQVKAGIDPAIEVKQVKGLLMFIRLEMLIVAMIPLLAVLIARGYGN
jgi:putative membrane protein